MKRMLRRVAVIAVVLLAVLALHKQVKKESAASSAEEDVAALGSISVMSEKNGVKLGTLEADPEGGVKISVQRDEGLFTYTFRDVAIDSWYADAVNFVVSARLMTGAGEDPYFQPEYGMDRESFAAILYRFAGGSKEEPQYHFDDVAEDKWYYDIISWVVNRRLMTGLEPNLFGVGQYMTCEHAIIGLYRLAGSPETDGSLAGYPYAMKVSDASRSAIDWAWKNGLITEVECVWYPTQAISRAQIALLLMRYSAMSSAAETQA